MKEKILALGIQVDNLCTMLPQASQVSSEPKGKGRVATVVFPVLFEAGIGGCD